MKKKGLIVATIVMVLVLAVSLTTATYAWFTASSKTSLQDFTVQVTSNNAVNIGLKKTSTVATTDIATSLFVTDACTYIRGTDGKIGGQWNSETEGLSPTITHNIQWGAQSTAVAALRGDSGYTTDTAKANYVDIVPGITTYSSTYTINAANLDPANSSNLTNVAAAKANIGDETAQNSGQYKNGDYVYMILGASPTKALEINTLCIAVDWSAQSGSTIGVLSSIHVAYRVTKADTATTATTGSWNDVDLFGSYHYNTAATGGVTSNIVNIRTGTSPNYTYGAAYADAYENTYGAAPGAKTYMTTIEGLSTTLNYIDQIELIIYMDGNDSDCVTSGTSNISGNIRIFFCTDKATSASTFPA